MDWIPLLLIVAKAVGFFLVMITVVAYSVLAERKIAAFIQDRVGPNRVSLPLIGSIPVLGPFLTRVGIWQPLVDGVKTFLKEDFTPSYVRKAYFWLAPAMTAVPSVLVFAVIPFGSMLGDQHMVIANLNVGILFTFGIVSLGVYGVVMAGYASNSKFPLLGSIRSSAQMISYELAMGMSVIPLVMIVSHASLSGAAGSGWEGYLSGTDDMNLTRFVAWQAQNGWLVFWAPLSFIIFLVSAFAETNRTPFDLPECETELVSGYHTEYSSMRFALFMIAENANIVAAASMMVTLFFGGWSGLNIYGWNLTAFLNHPAETVWMGVGHIALFMAKVVALVCLFIWVRWMLPRFRYDQLMDLGWRRFMPLALANIVITAFVLYFRH
jgi:NADH-quinone oxidoreductase subunit H